MIIRKVIKGDGRGKNLGFSTANLRLYKKDKIKFGVWAVLVSTLPAAEVLKGVAYVGPIPTFNIRSPRIEIHLLNFSKNLYNKKIRVEFIKYLRPIKKFKDKKSLVAQIKRDCKKAKRILLRPWRRQIDFS